MQAVGGSGPAFWAGLGRVSVVSLAYTFIWA